VSPRTRVVARGFTFAVGLGYAIAAAVTIQKAFSGLDFLRSYRWPLYASEAALLALIALTLILGATVHIAGLVTGCAMLIAVMVANFDSESALAPVVGISTGLLAVIYFRVGWGSLRLLSRLRVLMLLATVALAVLAIARLEETPIQLNWERVRTPSGSIQLRRFPGVEECTPGPAVAHGDNFVDEGCSESIPRKRAWFVIGYSTIGAALAIGALQGAPALRRLPDGTEVPTWI
jgi:hypothetical protein